LSALGTTALVSPTLDLSNPHACDTHPRNAGDTYAQENEDSNVDPVHNGSFSYAYYHAIIVEGGRNDLD